MSHNHSTYIVKVFKYQYDGQLMVINHHARTSHDAKTYAHNVSLNPYEYDYIKVYHGQPSSGGVEILHIESPYNEAARYELYA